MSTEAMNNSERATPPAIYINPQAPQELKDTLEEVFPDVKRVSADYVEALVGRLLGEGPTLAEHAAAIVDENGKLNLFAFDVEQYRDAADDALPSSNEAAEQ